MGMTIRATVPPLIPRSFFPLFGAKVFSSPGVVGRTPLEETSTVELIALIVETHTVTVLVGVWVDSTRSVELAAWIVETDTITVLVGFWVN